MLQRIFLGSEYMPEPLQRSIAHRGENRDGRGKYWGTDVSRIAYAGSRSCGSGVFILASDAVISNSDAACWRG